MSSSSSSSSSSIETISTSISNELNNINNNHPFKEVHEIIIPMPYGNLAGKWWGGKNIQPIIALHGWQDNAGTFDTLIPLLPINNDTSYLALDFPGHGLSARFPNGMIYGTMDYVYMLHNITKRYNWTKISIIGHSMGGIVGFLYASIFPERVKLLISIDTIKSHTLNDTYQLYFLTQMDNQLRNDLRNQDLNSEPLSFSYDEMIGKMKQEHTMLDIPAKYAPYLLKRGIAKSKLHKNKFYFTRDSRLKIFNTIMFPQHTNLELVRRIKCPYLFIKALDAPYVENKRYLNETIDVLKKENSKFELFGVPGDHHVHLTNPSIVCGKITKFIKNYNHNNNNNNESVVIESKL